MVSGIALGMVIKLGHLLVGYSFSLWSIFDPAFLVISFRMAKIKTQATAHTGEDMEHGKHSSIAGGTEILYSHAGNQSGGFSENLE